MAEHLPFNALRAFEAAARHLSFKLAAEELFVTPAAISQQIRSLEETLDVELFHRYKQKIQLTDAGKRGLPKLREGFALLSDGVNLIRDPAESMSLTVWSSPSFAGKWLVPRLTSFREQQPGIDLHISANRDLIDDGHAKNSIPADNFRRDHVDVAIRFGQGDYPGCRVDKLFHVSAIPLCSPDLMVGKQALKKPSDLKNHTLLHDDTPYEGRPSWSDWMAQAGVDDLDATHGISFNSVSLALAAAIDGQGVALTLQALAADDLQAGRLVTPFELSLPMPQAYYLISLEERADLPKIRLFREWILDFVEDLDKA